MSEPAPDRRDLAALAEEERLAWRELQFLHTGVSGPAAHRLALSNADVGVARKLAAASCPPNLIYRILR